MRLSIIGLAFIPAIACLMYSPAARAGAPMVFGFSPEGSALSRSNTADPSPAEAPAANPAAAAAPGLRVRMGYGYAALRLRIDGAPMNIPDASGVHFAAQFGHAFGQSNAIGLAFSVYMPDTALATLSFDPATKPQFPLYTAVLQRTVADAVAAFRLGPLSFGGGVSLGLSVGGAGTSFALEQDASGTRAESALDVELPYRIGALLGARAEFGRISFGLSFRSAMAVDISLDNSIRIGLIDNPLQGTTQVNLRGTSGYEPARLGSAVSVNWTERLRSHAALEIGFYGASPPPVADVHFDIALGTVPSQFEARFIEPRFRSTLSPRLGLEYKKPLKELQSKKLDDNALGIKPWAWVLRGGYAYSPSPVPRQTGLTSYADSNRHTLSAGGGYRLGKALGVEFFVQAAAALHWLSTRKEQKPSDSLPHSSYVTSGEIFFGSLGMEALWR